MNETRSRESQPGQHGRPVNKTHELAAPTIGDVAIDAAESLRTYAKKRPEVVAMWCLGIGFVLGWKLKPW